MVLLWIGLLLFWFPREIFFVTMFYFLFGTHLISPTLIWAHGLLYEMRLIRVCFTPTLCALFLFSIFPCFGYLFTECIDHYSYFRPWEQRVTEDTYLVVNRLHVAVWELSSGERVQWERKIWGIQSWVWHCWWWLCLTTTLRRSRTKKFDWDYSCSYCCWSCPDCYCKSWTKHEKKSGTTFAAGSPG